MVSPRGPSTVFEGEKLKSGVYKIQNLYTETFLDIHMHSMEVCCRPANDLADGRGLVSPHLLSVICMSDNHEWEIRRFGDGYAVWRVDPGNPCQFCSPNKGVNRSTPLFVTSYPAAWRIERAPDDMYHGFGYVRFYWGTTKIAWDLWGGSKDNGAPVKFHELGDWAWQVWKLTPVEVTPPQPPCEALNLGPLPPYDDSEPGQCPAHVQHVEQERDDQLGTVVTKVTIIVTTREGHRVNVSGDA